VWPRPGVVRETVPAQALSNSAAAAPQVPAVYLPPFQRNALYTGVTRAKKLVVLAGSRRALAAAVRTKGAGRRSTALAHRGRGEDSEGMSGSHLASWLSACRPGALGWPG